MTIQIRKLRVHSDICLSVSLSLCSTDKTKVAKCVYMHISILVLIIFWTWHLHGTWMCRWAWFLNISATYFSTNRECLETWIRCLHATVSWFLLEYSSQLIQILDLYSCVCERTWCSCSYLHCICAKSKPFFEGLSSLIMLTVRPCFPFLKFKELPY